MKSLYPVARLRDDLQEIDAHLDAPLRPFMIGGGALGFHGLKDRTKDVDVVTTRRKDADTLAAVLDGLEYEALKEPSPEYEQLKATYLYGKDGHAQWDIYVRRVCGMLPLSPGMQQRATPLEGDFEHLDVRVVHPQDILVFKSITERPADRVDIESIHASGPDWDSVLEEMRWQSRQSEQPWGAEFYGSMVELDRDGYAVPILKELEALSRQEMEDWAVMHVLREQPRSLEEIMALLEPELEEGEDPQVIQDAVAHLEKAGRIRSAGSRYEPV